MFENLVEELKIWGELLAQEYKDRLKNEGISASGRLYNSVRSSVNISGNHYEVVLNLEEWWKYIEGGRGVTRNNGDGELRRAILEWIRVKPILPRPYNGKLPTENQLAYLISRKIHNLGYEGKRPLGRILDENRDAVYRDIEKALQKDLNTDVLNILRTIE